MHHATGPSALACLAFPTTGLWNLVNGLTSNTAEVLLIGFLAHTFPSVYCVSALRPHGTFCYRGTWLQLAIGSAEQHLLSPSGAIFSPPPVNRLDSIPFLASLTLCPFSLFTTRTLALVTVRGVDHSPTFETPSRPVHPEWDAFLICSQLLGLPLPFVYCLHCSLVAVTQGGPDTIPIISYPLVHFFSFRPASYATGPQPWETLSLLKVSLFHTPP